MSSDGSVPVWKSDAYLVMRVLVRDEIDRGALVVLDVETPRWTRPLVIATRARAPTPPLVSVIVEQLKRLHCGAVTGEKMATSSPTATSD